MDFKKKIILVTGGSSGIGLRTVIEFVKHSAEKVYTCGRSILKWEIAKVLIDKELGKESNRIIFIQTDIRVESEVRDLIKQIFDDNGQLDICVNNAGVNIPPIELWNTTFPLTQKSKNIIKYTFKGETNDRSEQTPLFTNIFGTMFCLKWELKYILEKNDSNKPVNIVNISSTYDNVGTVLYPTYAASKSGVSSLTKSVAGQVAMERLKNPKTPLIVINSINPGATLTPLFLENLPPHLNLKSVVNGVIKEIPLNRMAAKREIAHAILLLSSTKNTTYMTGSSLVVDGGWSSLPDYDQGL